MVRGVVYTFHHPLLLLSLPRWPSPVPESPTHRVPQFPEDKPAGEWALGMLLSPQSGCFSSWHKFFCSRSQQLTSRLPCCSTLASSTTATKSFHSGWACWHGNTGARQCLSPAKGTREGKLGLGAAAGIAACFPLPATLWQGACAHSTFFALCMACGMGRLVWRVVGSQWAPVEKVFLWACSLPGSVAPQ